MKTCDPAEAAVPAGTAAVERDHLGAALTKRAPRGRQLIGGSAQPVAEPLDPWASLDTIVGLAS